MIVTTMNDIPGYEVDEVFGEVMGLTVRSRNVGSQIGAGLKSLLGGELKGMTKALVASREQVRQRMIEEAEAHGANAIIAMRFDTSEIGRNWTEICAYGTAVRVHKRNASCLFRTRPGARHQAMSPRAVSAPGCGDLPASLSLSDESRCLAPGRGRFGRVD